MRESIDFQKYNRGSRTGRAAVVCISASEGSWSPIIVNHMEVS